MWENNFVLLKLSVSFIPQTYSLICGKYEEICKLEILQLCAIFLELGKKSLIYVDKNGKENILKVISIF